MSALVLSFSVEICSLCPESLQNLSGHCSDIKYTVCGPEVMMVFIKQYQGILKAVSIKISETEVSWIQMYVFGSTVKMSLKLIYEVLNSCV